MQRSGQVPFLVVAWRDRLRPAGRGPSTGCRSWGSDARRLRPETRPSRRRAPWPTSRRIRRSLRLVLRVAAGRPPVAVDATRTPLVQAASYRLGAEPDAMSAPTTSIASRAARPAAAKETQSRAVSFAATSAPPRSTNDQPPSSGPRSAPNTGATPPAEKFRFTRPIIVGLAKQLVADASIRPTLRQKQQHQAPERADARACDTARKTACVPSARKSNTAVHGLVSGAGCRQATTTLEPSLFSLPDESSRPALRSRRGVI